MYITIDTDSASNFKVSMKCVSGWFCCGEAAGHYCMCEACVLSSGDCCLLSLPVHRAPLDCRNIGFCFFVAFHLHFPFSRQMSVA